MSLGGLFGGAPKPDYSAIESQKAAIAAQEAEADRIAEEQKQKDAASLRARTGRSGQSSLLTGLETGVQPVTGRNTLG